MTLYERDNLYAIAYFYFNDCTKLDLFKNIFQNYILKRPSPVDEGLLYILDLTLNLERVFNFYAAISATANTKVINASIV